ncbi:MAG TPA: arginine--tRNA ligase [Candidatus Tumulicola sp.]|jgi:arginyl-tRNA synthetase
MNPITTEPHALELRAFGDALAAAARTLYPDAGPLSATFEAPRRPEFGDFSTNAAFALAKFARRSPQEVAKALVAAVEPTSCDAATFASIEPVGGFINVRFAPAVWQRELARLSGGALEPPPRRERVSLEFGSANPTGPLVVVQGRSLSIGDALANAMRFCGYDVFAEWIINDAGAQIERLGRSLYARYRQVDDAAFPFPDDGYPGEYLVPIARTIRERDGVQWDAAPEAEWLPYFEVAGRDAIVDGQRQTAERFGVRYDLWQSERALHDAGKIREGIKRLRELGLTYERDGATFFRTTDFGDDKDRVIVRSDGRPTYYALDVTYHYEKLKRADRVIDILGPDHHGYVGRLKALAAALGYPGRLEALISGQIALVREGEQVSMSKRAGAIETLDDILDEVGNDAARFFFVMLAPESPLAFDLALAVAQNNDNPVYYVQYGHARIASVLRNAGPAPAAGDDADLARLVHPAELALIRRLVEFPRVVEGVVVHLAPHRLARYARDVAADFHAFYTECKILTDDPATRGARLRLCVATKDVLARALAIVGVGAPDSM